MLPGPEVGLIFESENGKLPYGVSHIIWKIVADKNRNHMLLITGGKPGTGKLPGLQ